MVWSAIQTGEEAKYDQEIEQYIRWKSKLKLYLRETYGQIKFDGKVFCKDWKRGLMDEKDNCG